MRELGERGVPGEARLDHLRARFRQGRLGRQQIEQAARPGLVPSQGDLLGLRRAGQEVAARADPLRRGAERVIRVEHLEDHLLLDALTPLFCRAGRRGCGAHVVDLRPPREQRDLEPDRRGVAVAGGRLVEEVGLGRAAAHDERRQRRAPSHCDAGLGRPGRGAGRHEIGPLAHGALDQRLEAVRDAERRHRVGGRLEVVRNVRRQAHREGQRAARGLQRALDRFQGELHLGERRLRLQHVGDGGEAHAVALLRRLEVRLRFL